MSAHRISCIPVQYEFGRLSGIISKTDMASRFLRKTFGPRRHAYTQPIRPILSIQLDANHLNCRSALVDLPPISKNGHDPTCRVHLVITSLFGKRF